MTGSVGKTSTKEMLRAVLSGQGRAHAAEASYNNHWGVPLTLARMPEDTRFRRDRDRHEPPRRDRAAGRMARPHVAMITTVAPAHLEAFDSLDGHRPRKGRDLRGLEPGGMAMLQRGLADVADPDRRRRGPGMPGSVTFGASPRCRSPAQPRADRATARRWCAARPGGTRLLFKISTPGRHFALNALAVLAVAGALGLDPALARWRSGPLAPAAGTRHARDHRDGSGRRRS